MMNTMKPGILKVFTYKGFAPVCARRADGTPWGTDISFLEKFAAAHHLKIEWTVLETFDDIWVEPGKDACDIAAAGITETEKRKEQAGSRVVWSHNYFHVRRSFLIRTADAERFSWIGKLGPENTVAVTAGSTADIDIQERNPGGANVDRSYSVQAEAVQALLDGKIDAFGEGDVSNDYLASLHPGKLLVTDKHEMIGKANEPFSFPVRGASEILDVLNAWLATQDEADYTKIKFE
jgi:ABC-type amino acid transport substrate-binding protein